MWLCRNSIPLLITTVGKRRKFGTIGSEEKRHSENCEKRTGGGKWLNSRATSKTPDSDSRTPWTGWVDIITWWWHYRKKQCTMMPLMTKWETAFAMERLDTTRRSSKKAVARSTTVVSIIQAGRSEGKALDEQSDQSECQWAKKTQSVESFDQNFKLFFLSGF